MILALLSARRITVHRMSDAPSVQRSFRLSASTSSLLDELAAMMSESRNALVERLLAEAVRTQRHPLIGFREGAAGRREPAVVGTRLLVRQVAAQLRATGGDVEGVAEYLQVSSAAVRAAISYYADFDGEVDVDAAWADRIEADEFARWQREQAALA
jgi:uncharacterized protein (DUF433 family)